MGAKSHVNECQVHGCNKNAGRACKYCHKPFCELHSKPAAPFWGNIHADTPEARIAKAMSGKSHPCAEYVDGKAAEDKQTWKKYGEMLDGMTERSRPHQEVIFHSGKKPASPKHQRVPVAVKPSQVKHSHEDVREIAMQRAKENTKLVQATQGNFITKLTIGCAIALIAFLAIYFIDLPPREQLVSENITQNSSDAPVQTLAAPEPEKFSFREFLENKAEYQNKQIVARGTLHKYVKGTSASGTVVYSVVDDDNQELVLERLTSEQKALFGDGRSDTPYEISGTFKMTTNGPSIVVSAIRQYSRALI